MPQKISLNNVGKVYQSGTLTVSALSGVSLDIEAGEMVAVMGPSGSGKSTLMHIIGLLDRPSEGVLHIDEEEISLNMSDQKLAQLRSHKIGFVFQNFNLLPHMNALDNVLMPTTYTTQKRNETRTRAHMLLELVGLEHRLQHKPGELSGGEKQRVAIARALINDPDIILADEPTGNLDSATGDEIISLLQELHQQGKTILVITHDEDIADICPRVVRLRDGAVVSDSGIQITQKATHKPQKLIKTLIQTFVTLTEGTT